MAAAATKSHLQSPSKRSLRLKCTLVVLLLVTAAPVERADAFAWAPILVGVARVGAAVVGAVVRAVAVVGRGAAVVGRGAAVAARGTRALVTRGTGAVGRKFADVITRIGGPKLVVER